MTDIPIHWSFSSHKGGVGKTLLAGLIAAAAADAGHRVLAVDMDPQANLTRRLATPLPGDLDERRDRSLAAVLFRPRRGDAARIVTPCGWPSPYRDLIDVTPGHLDLEHLPETAAQAGASRRLLTTLAGVVTGYDLVLIDCPPGLRGHLIDLAWTATDLIWVPCEPETDAMLAARRVIERVDLDQDLLGDQLQVGGLICTRHRMQLNLHQQRRIELASILGADALCPVVVPELVLFKGLAESALPLTAVRGSGPYLHIARDTYAWMRHRTAALTVGGAS